MKFKNLVQLQSYFSNELTCYRHLEHTRWNGTPTCPHCGSTEHYRTATRFKHPQLKDHYQDFVCKDCKKKYTVLTGTIYESSKVSLRLWFSALYLLTAHKKGICSVQLAKDIGVSQKTAWFMLHRLRTILEDTEPGILYGEISSDESFIGGRNKNRHWDKKCQYSGGRNFMDKTPVIGLLQKGGKLICKVIKNTRAETIQPIVFEHVALESKLYTDDYVAYTGMSFWYRHYVIDHSRKKYTKGKATTNNIEGVWTHLKKCLYGIYHCVSRKHMQKYVDEFVFRWNNRDLDDPDKFELALSFACFFRLKYKSLINRLQ